MEGLGQISTERSLCNPATVHTAGAPPRWSRRRSEARNPLVTCPSVTGNRWSDGPVRPPLPTRPGGNVSGRELHDSDGNRQAPWRRRAARRECVRRGLVLTAERSDVRRSQDELDRILDETGRINLDFTVGMPSADEAAGRADE